MSTPTILWLATLAAHAMLLWTGDPPTWLWGWVLGLVAGVTLVAQRSSARSRERLERQRRRIAMDLHDELGSGLGSIGLMASVLRDGDTRPELAGAMADTAEDLGDALTDIVWALRDEAACPSNLLDFLAARGKHLFATNPGAVVVRAPTCWPDVELTPAVRRNVQAIAVEALHNAARHAGASHVELGLEPGPVWRLWVSDDGCGIGTSRSRPGGGSGLAGMHKRAAAAGADLDIRSVPGHGTTITLTFHPHGAPAKSTTIENILRSPSRTLSAWTRSLRPCMDSSPSSSTSNGT